MCASVCLCVCVSVCTYFSSITFDDHCSFSEHAKILRLAKKRKAGYRVSPSFVCSLLLLLLVCPATHLALGLSLSHRLPFHSQPFVHSFVSSSFASSTPKALLLLLLLLLSIALALSHSAPAPLPLFDDDDDGRARVVLESRASDEV